MEENVKGFQQEVTKEDIIYRLVQEGKITLQEFLVLVQDIKITESSPVPWYPVYPINPYPCDGGIIYTKTYDSSVKTNYVNRT